MVKAVLCDTPEEMLAQRKRIGADRWDEMWNGVLHMPPMPNRVHQDFNSDLETWIRDHWARPFGNRVHREINLASIGGWPDDYRIPDLLLLTPDRFYIDHNEYFEGPPLVVVEIHSPGDEAYEKLDFYAEIGVPEAWIIDRDSRKPEVFELKRGEYVAAAVNDEGWLVSRATGIRFRTKRAKKLLIQFGDDADSRTALPES
jgi:Uma2 family endonuclease